MCRMNTFVKFFGNCETHDSDIYTNYRRQYGIYIIDKCIFLSDYTFESSNIRPQEERDTTPESSIISPENEGLIQQIIQDAWRNEDRELKSDFIKAVEMRNDYFKKALEAVETSSMDTSTE